MGRNRQASFTKRKKEQQRQERKVEKAKRRAARATDKPDGEDDEPLAVPQPVEAMTAEETRIALEHAMNPGTRREEGPKS